MLRHFRRAAILAALLAGPPAFAGGDYHVLGHDDSWEIGTGTDSQGNPYCSAQAQSDDQSYGLVLLIYPTGDDPSFELHAFKSGWSIPGNADVPTKFLFSNGDDWSADGSPASNNSSVVDYTIDIKDMKDFLSDFAQSTSLVVHFVNGTEPDWTADLTGTSSATQDLLDCSQSLMDQQNGGTQPYAKPQSTQPYGDSSGGQKNL